MELKKQIIEHFAKHEDKLLAAPMETYMKNRFKFFGIRATERRDLCKELLKELKTLDKEETIQLSKALWMEPQRELHYFAQELLFQNIKKKLEKPDIQNLEWFVVNQSWWDTVDFIAPKIMGAYFLKFPEERKTKVEKWIQSENIWLIRSAILFQLKYKEKIDLPFAFEVILKTCHTKEFFINKAIGWLLRENSRSYPKQITAFVHSNEKLLSNLSKKEALRLL